MKNWFELKDAFRGIKNYPGQAIICIIVMALFIAISWTAFSLYYYSALKKVEFSEPDHWFGLVGNSQGFDSRFVNSIDSYSYQVLAKNDVGFELFGALRPDFTSLNHDDETTRLSLAYVSPDIFAASKLPTRLGRLFGTTENLGTTAAVISFEIWQNKLAGQENVIGELIRLDGINYTVVGVMAEQQSFFAPFDVYLPLNDAIPNKPDLQQRVIPIGKLKSLNSLSAVNANIARITSSIESEYPDVFTYSHQYWLEPLHTAISITNEEANLVFGLLGLVGIAIAVLGSVNLTNLFISRGLERQREFALRSAVGSSPITLVRHSLLETLVICIVGTGVGVILSYLSAVYISHLMTSVLQGMEVSIPMAISPSTTKEEIIALAVMVISIWLISSAVPVWHIGKQDTSTVLASTGKGNTDAKKGNGNTIIVCLQVVCSCFLLVVCGCLVYAMSQLNSSDFGVKSEGYWTARVDLPYVQFDQNQRQDYLDQLKEALVSNPEVSSTTFSTGIPGMMTVETRYGVNDRDIRRNGIYPEASLVSVDTDFFGTLDIRILQGRNFDSADVKNTLPVAVVGELFAKKLWPDESAIGKRIQLDANAEGEWVTVIGVARRIISNWPAAFTPELIYRPLSQTQPQNFFITANMPKPSSDGIAILRSAANQVNSDIALYRLLTYNDHFYSLGAGAVFFSELFLGVAFATAILAVLGIYGVISRTVLQRFTEIGIRRALGSSKQKVVWLYLRRSLVYVAVGSVLGGGAALMIYQTISMFLATQAAAIPIIYLTVCLGLAVFISVATYIPVRKAISLDPGDALHQN